MRYLVHRGTGTILGVNDDLVVVDINDDDQDEADILELADNVPAGYKPVVLRNDECPVGYLMTIFLVN
jgi:hypothetical protein